MRRAALLALALLALAPAAAEAGRSQVSVLQDDRLLVYSGVDAQTSALDDAVALGVDYIRTALIWDRVAPPVRPAGFRADDPAAYGDRWDPWDTLVDRARSRGIKVLVTVTGPGPEWASGCPAGTSRRGICKPSTPEFERFVRAAGRRFGSRVSTWSIWNEPNLDGWLKPQRARARGRTYVYSARKYRDLYRAAVRALRATGNGRDRILLGETAPIANRRAVAPVSFYRELLCLDSSGRPFRGTAASIRGCGGFTRLPASGVAHHPYTPAVACTPRCGGGPADVTIASLGRLSGVLDQGVRRGRISSAARTRIWLTEFGFQSSPPNRGPISLSEQAGFLNWSEWIAFRNPRVRSFAQYELADPRAKTFNTGLRFGSFKRKPAWGAWRTPLFVVRAGRGFVTVFGGVRPGGVRSVRVQARARDGRFRAVTTVRTSRSGYLSVRLPARRTWRLAWTLPGGAIVYSRVAGVR